MTSNVEKNIFRNEEDEGLILSKDEDQYNADETIILGITSVE